MYKCNFFALGGFPANKFMEDFDFVVFARKHGRVRILDLPVRTSARRWSMLGMIWNSLNNQVKTGIFTNNSLTFEAYNLGPSRGCTVRYTCIMVMKIIVYVLFDCCVKVLRTWSYEVILEVLVIGILYVAVPAHDTNDIQQIMGRMC